MGALAWNAKRRALKAAGITVHRTKQTVKK
jgi:hypothetical protein